MTLSVPRSGTGEDRTHEVAAMLRRAAARRPVCAPDSALVVDDDRNLLAVMRAALTRSLTDVHLRFVTSGEEALEAHRASPVALVVMDVQMPGLDGWETLARLRTHATPPVALMMSGSATLDDARRHGADLFLEKPFATAALRAAVEDGLALAAARWPGRGVPSRVFDAR